MQKKKKGVERVISPHLLEVKSSDTDVVPFLSYHFSLRTRISASMKFCREGEVAFASDVGGASIWDYETSFQPGLLPLEGA